MSLVNVTTAPDRIVKDTRGNKVPAQFSVNPHDPFWARLIAAGDVVEVKPDATKPASEPPAATTPSTTPTATAPAASNKESGK